ncbi:MAG TPA: tRNA (N(6)-L-threonylcarbamoyladenosine(37)-C(2))-methylthiotransferase MtaB [Dehalococcoidales bacterium]|nr:tRNA (N(6)-L-threonylcarbamoyladenosine(37)-C(2))-methylthiotransferase MtaB [Dehalococcoidales bacterium]
MVRSSEAISITLDTVGCKLNQAETQLFARQFARAGYRVVSADNGADVYILNTCTVTHVADGKCRRLLNQARRRNPDALVVAVGCYVERARQDLAQLDGVDLVLDNSQKMNLVPLLEESGYLSRPSAGAASTNADFRTRAFVRVQDGCNNFCSYCIVPLVRGREKSLPVGRVIDEVKQRVADGDREVVLTGTEIGAYSDEGIGLAGLLRRILEETEISRLRLSSLQPQEITAELMELWDDERLCRHFHLSLQSGSAAVLGRMGRRYSAADYKRAVDLIREVVPGAAITTDVIVGFPGETEAEFEESYNFARQRRFARIHVFPYSPRPGTKAAAMPAKVDDKTKQERSRRMRALGRQGVRNFRRQFLGKTVMVLWEKQNCGVWSGLTDNYIRVFTKSDKDLTNQLLPVKLV